MPPSPNASGRHRRRNHHGTPFTAAAVGAALVTVGGVNLPAGVGGASLASSGAMTGLPLVEATAAGSLGTAAAPQAPQAGRYQQTERARADALVLQQALDYARSQQVAAEAAALAVRRQAEAERAARERASTTWVLPVLSYQLTAGFGEGGRLWSNGHTGQDFAAPMGTPTRAVHQGTVVFAGWDGPYGKKIAIRHEDGTETWYAHLSAILVKVGDQVDAAQVIGRVGSTGNSTGPHAHLEVRINGRPIDPIPFLRAKGLNP